MILGIEWCDFTTFGRMCRVFANGQGDRGSIPGRVTPKTQNCVVAVEKGNLWVTFDLVRIIQIYNIDSKKCFQYIFSAIIQNINVVFICFRLYSFKNQLSYKRGTEGK